MSLHPYSSKITVAHPADFEEILRAAKDDGWDLPTVPTHVIKNGDDIVGYWSFGNIPLLLAWHHSDMKVRESLHAYATVDTVASERGYNCVMIPLTGDSAYCPLMEKLGFKEMGTAKLYIKEI